MDTGNAIIKNWNKLGFCREHDALAHLHDPREVCDYCRVGTCINSCDIFPLGELVSEFIATYDKQTKGMKRLITKWFGI